MCYLTDVQVQANVLSHLKSADCPVNVDEEPLSEEPFEANVELVPVFGAPPVGMEDLYALYAKHLALGVSMDVRESNTASPNDMRSMVFALALDRITPANEELNFDSERNRLNQVRLMLQQCRVW